MRLAKAPKPHDEGNGERRSRFRVPSGWPCVHGISSAPDAANDDARLRGMGRVHYIQTPMSRLPASVRTFAMILGLFQAGASPAAAIADALLPLRAPAAHVEDHTRRSCLPAHPDDCALCRVVSLSANVPREAPHGLVASVVHDTAPDVRGVAPAATWERGTPPSRAPPAV
jgi:hypothetical protein